VYESPTDSPECGIVWKTCTRERWDPDRLFDRRCERLSYVGSYRAYVWRVVRFFPYKVYIDSNLRDTLGYE
jgi:hypothetical protein